MVSDFETAKSHRTGKIGRPSFTMEGSWKHFCRNSCNIKLHKLIILVILLLVLLPVLTHYYISKFNDSAMDDAYHSRSKLEALDDVTYLKAADLKMRIEELLRIKASVNNELRELEYKRQKLQNDISAQNQRLEEFKSLYTKKESDLEKANLSLEQAKLAQQEVIQNKNPALAPPRRILPSLDAQLLPPPALSHSCTLPYCFDYSRCSLSSGFPVFFYPSNYSLARGISEPVMNAVVQATGYNPHVTLNPDIACLYMVIVGPETTTKDLSQLRYWRGDGRNHLLLAPLGINQIRFRAFVASTNFSAGSTYRPNFDLIIPPLLGPPGGDTWQNLVSVTPAFRPYFLTFLGSCNALPANEINQEETNLQSILLNLATSSTDEFHFDFSCGESSATEYALCGTPQSRVELLRQSTFVLILSPPNPAFQTTPALQTRLFEAILNGAVPVLVGPYSALPFADVLDWGKAVVTLPRPRLPELHYMLRSVPDRDILAMRLQGRFIWEKYMGSAQAILDATISIYRQRLGIPPLPVSEEPAPSVFNATFMPLKTEILTPDPENEESLGPIEPPFPSPSFTRNLSYVWLQGHALWNQYGTPHLLYPFTPWDTVPPSEAKFLGSQYGFRPINGGVGGSGKEFSTALGGNLPREQFTIIVLTYEREVVLLQSLMRLQGLPYLHKVLVVWNSPKPPVADLRWPDIGVPIQVIRTSRNSLNNRFLPYESIETEAILSVDDDAHLKHDEIIFSFRVWRENRDRIVGFPGRFHAWDLENRAWLYNSNYSCELSMVLTGAAFFHKYYAYMYTHVMPQAIRDKVDEFMNCEDIAMNFLVSHVTRLPPVKVTSRWTFRCPGCPVSLSEDDTHFQERHKCINFFAKVYGYMPLLHTQYRVDSVLFKTRIPHDKQKCFKYI